MVADETREAVLAMRRDMICRLRRQLEDGAYEPPTSDVVDRLIDAVLHAPSPPEAGGDPPPAPSPGAERRRPPVRGGKPRKGRI